MTAALVVLLAVGAAVRVLVAWSRRGGRVGWLDRRCHENQRE